MTKVIVITSSGSFVLPNDWNPDNNSVHLIGGGAAAVNVTDFGGSGGGGGAYGRLTNFPVLANEIIEVTIGAGGTPPLQPPAIPDFAQNRGKATSIKYNSVVYAVNGGGDVNIRDGGSGGQNVPLIRAGGAGGIGVGGGGGGGAGGTTAVGGAAPGDSAGGAGGADSGGAGGTTGSSGGPGGDGTVWTDTQSGIIRGAGGGGGSSSLPPGGAGGAGGKCGGGGGYGTQDAGQDGAGAAGIVVLVYEPVVGAAWALMNDVAPIEVAPPFSAGLSEGAWSNINDIAPASLAPDFAAAAAAWTAFGWLNGLGHFVSGVVQTIVDGITGVPLRTVGAASVQTTVTEPNSPVTLGTTGAVSVKVTVTETNSPVTLGTTGTVSVKVTVNGSTPVRLATQSAAAVTVDVAEPNSPLTVGTSGQVSVQVTVAEPNSPFTVGTSGAVSVQLTVNEPDSPVSLRTAGVASLQVTVNGQTPIRLGTTGDLESAQTVTFNSTTPVSLGTQGSSSLQVTVNGITPVSLVNLLDVASGRIFRPPGKKKTYFDQRDWVVEKPPIFVDGLAPVPLGTAGDVHVAHSPRQLKSRSALRLGTRGIVVVLPVRVQPKPFAPRRVVTGRTRVVLGTHGGAKVLPFPVRVAEGTTAIHPQTRGDITTKQLLRKEKLVVPQARTLTGVFQVPLGTKGGLIVFPFNARVAAHTGIVPLSTIGTIQTGTVPPPEDDIMDDLEMLAYAYYQIA